MEKNRISDFLESIDSEKWNCVYQANGMTLLTTKEYDYKYKERVNLQTQLKKQQEIIDKAIEYIENGDLLYLANKNSVVYRDNVEIKAVADRLNELLQILEDKEV